MVAKDTTMEMLATPSMPSTPVPITVPAGGESVVEATVGRWYKQPGEIVQAGEDIVELETDKVNVAVQSSVMGILEVVEAPTGTVVGINDVLGFVGNGESLKNVPGIELLDPTRNPVVPTTTETSGPETIKPLPPVVIPPADPAIRITPTAMSILAKNGIEPSAVQGTGPNGLITKEDALAYIERNKAVITPLVNVVGIDNTKTNGGAPITSPGGNGTNTVETPVDDKRPVLSPRSLLLNDERREIVEPMSRKRKTIAVNLMESQHTTATLTTFNEVDLTAVMEIRKRRRDSFKEKHGVNLGLMSFFTKAVIGSLKAFPYLNAEIQGDNIIKKLYYDIGIAVNTDNGLVVPVVRSADKLNFAGIEKAIGDLAARARANGLNLPDYMGGTFTITNGGIYGSLMSTPILNMHQVGILGMHKFEERAVVVSGQVVIRTMMYLALSYDHRIVDGSDAVRFLARVKELIEDPESLLLEG